MTGHGQVDYDDGMHPRPASSQTSHRARSCRPQSGIAPIAAHDHGASERGLLCQLPGPMDIQMGGSAVKGLDPALELADLRRGWGAAYRITWDSGRFRATHIVSGQAVDAGNAAELRKLIRDQHRA